MVPYVLVGAMYFMDFFFWQRQLFTTHARMRPVQARKTSATRAQNQ